MAHRLGRAVRLGERTPATDHRVPERSDRSVAGEARPETRPACRRPASRLGSVETWQRRDLAAKGRAHDHKSKNSDMKRTPSLSLLVQGCGYGSKEILLT